MSVKIGLISDTHLASPVEILPPEVARQFVGVDVILHAGDLVSMHVLDELRVVAPVQAVRGNADLVDCHSLPLTRIVEQGATRIGLCHGDGSPHDLSQRVLQYFSGRNVDVIVFGHSHQPSIEERAGVVLVNPGSPTHPRAGAERSVGILELSDSKIDARIEALDRVDAVS